MKLFERIPAPTESNGSLSHNLGKAWPTAKVVACFDPAPSLLGNGHDWWFKDAGGIRYSLSCRNDVFVTGAPIGFSTHEFESWLRTELAKV